MLQKKKKKQDRFLAWVFITLLPHRRCAEWLGTADTRSLQGWMVSLKSVLFVSEATLHLDFKCLSLTDPDLTLTLSRCVYICGFRESVCTCVCARLVAVYLYEDGLPFWLSYLSPSSSVCLCLAGKPGGIFSTVKVSSYTRWLTHRLAGFQA